MGDCMRAPSQTQRKALALLPQFNHVPMRDIKAIQRKLFLDRESLKDAKAMGGDALIRHFENEIAKAQQDLRAIKRYGGEATPMRTPWKRLQGSDRHFEEV